MEILKAKGKTILMGNEAIVRGALEAGVEFISTYPGTPSSEIGDTFNEIKTRTRKRDFYFEYSTNEKVALEAGVGASFVGLKTLVAMKNFGLNVALDALAPFCYTGSKGPFVLVVADDPSCHSSGQSEENSRGFSYLVHIPILEPADPQECKDFTKIAFSLSEKYNLPVMIRTTTRVAHQRMPVTLTPFFKRKKRKLSFVRDPQRFVTMPPRVLEMKKELLEKIERIRQEFSERTKLNKIENKNSSRLGIITSGVSYLYTKEVLDELNLKLPILKLGVFYPLAEKKIAGFLKQLNEVLVVEELEGWIEWEVERISRGVNPKIKIWGKNVLPETEELNPDLVMEAVIRFLRKRTKISKLPKLPKIKHTPRFCQEKGGGCPYWQVFSAVKQLAPPETVFGGDIGCYMMASLPPFELYDYLSCMGSSLGIAHGIKKALEFSQKNPNQKVIAFIGDSTFFHAGLSSLANLVHKKTNILVIVLNNDITAMTGHQPYPGLAQTGGGEEGQPLDIEKVIKGLGVKNLAVVDQVKEFEKFKNVLKEFLKKKELAVIVASHPCWLYYEKRKRN